MSLWSGLKNRIRSEETPVNGFRFSIIHCTARVRPFRSFPIGWFESCKAWYDRCAHPEQVEYVLVVHKSNWREFVSRTGDWPIPRWASFRVICNEADANTAVTQGQAGADAALGVLWIGNHDDMFPPENWDVMLWQKFIESGKSEAVLHVTTGSPTDDTLFIPQIVTRSRVQRLGYAGHPSYESMFVDNEFTEHARVDGVVVDAREIRFEHRHPIFGAAQWDDVYQHENRPEAYQEGHQNYLRRRALGFPRENPPPSPSPASGDGASVVEISKRENPKIIACLLPGEWFSSEWVVAWTNLIVYLASRFAQVHPHFSYSSSVYVTRIELAQSVLAVKPDADLILWIDDDNIVTAEQVAMLMRDLEEHPEADAVCGWCWIYNHNTDQWLVSCGRSPTDERMMYTALPHREVLEAKGLVEVQASGFPVVLMRRGLLEKLGARAFVPFVDDKFMYGFTSEDAAFWKRATLAGLRLFCDTRVRVHHMKWRGIEPTFVKPEQIFDVAAARDAVAAD